MKLGRVVRNHDFGTDIPAGPHQTIVGVLLTAAAILGSSVANVTQATATARRYPMAATVAMAMLLTREL